MPPVSSSTILAQLHWRYATQSFDPGKKIPAELWSALEDALVLTPSSYGLQPWKFLVVTDPSIREQLVPAAYGQRQMADASHLVVLCAQLIIDEAFVDRFITDMATKRDFPIESMAGMRRGILGAMGRMDAANILHWSEKQCYIALGNFMTTAALAGVDTCPMEGFSPEKFDQILGLEAKGLRAVVCCPAGYRLDSDKYATLPKVRWDKSDIIEII